jgi:HK97 gp10 family phage protein
MNARIDAFEDRLRKATADGISRITNHYWRKCREAVGVSNPGVSISAKEMRKQAIAKFKGKRTAGLVTFTHPKKEYEGKDVDRYGKGKLKSTQWYDTSIDNNKRTATIYPYASKPGEPPRKRTGMGQASIQMEVDRGIPAGRVGVANAGKYMIYLNFGTRTIAARPWIEATLNKEKAVMAALLKAK